MPRPMLRRSTDILRSTLMGAALLTLCPSIVNAHVTATATSNESSSTTTKTIEIPEGTPVIVHFFRPETLLEYDPKHEDFNSAVLQVDSDVVIDGVIVIPKGSLGLAHIDSINYSAGKLFDGNDFHMMWVFSIASTHLALDPSRVPTIVVKHKLTYQYTAKLIHAIVTLPN